MAFSAYRMVYASVWDFRFNHTPLMRNLPMTYGAGSFGLDGFHEAMWTRQAGWGHQPSSPRVDAPFDAANRPRGLEGAAAEAVVGRTAAPASGLMRTFSGGEHLGRGGTSREPSKSGSTVPRGERMV